MNALGPLLSKQNPIYEAIFNFHHEFPIFFIGNEKLLIIRSLELEVGSAHAFRQRTSPFPMSSFYALLVIGASTSSSPPFRTDYRSYNSY